MRAAMAEPSAAAAPPDETAPCTMREFLLYFLSLGTFGFGGPIALAGYMQRDLVESRRWISKQDYLEGLALAQLAPGPLAAQLAIYLGWVRARVLGATLVACAFVAPSLAMVLAISALYVRYGGLPWMQGLFYGVGAAVIAIIVRSSIKLVRMTLERDWLLWTIFAVSAVVTGWTESEIVWVFLLSGVVALLVRTPPLGRGAAALALFPPHWLLAGLDGPATVPVLLKILWFFTGAGAVVFGSGLAIVPFLHGGVVNDFHWLDERQFLDAVAVAMITPGPVVITVGFIGYLVAGLAGALIAALGVFLPCYLFVVIPAPYYRRWARVPQIRSFVAGVTAAATGAIAGAAYVLGRRALIDWPTVTICALTLVLLVKARKIPEPVVILGAGLAGLLIATSARAQGPTAAASTTNAESIALPGGPPVDMDYLAYDPGSGRLFIPAGNTGKVDVLDTKTGALRTVDGWPTVKAGDRIVGPSSCSAGGGYVYVGNRADSSICALQATSLTRKGCAALPSSPDGVFYVAPTKEVWVTTPREKSLQVLALEDPAAPRLAGKIALEGEPEGYAVDEQRGAVFTNLRDKDRTLVLDAKSRKVVASFDPACGERGPRGIAFDAGTRRLFVACAAGGVKALDSTGKIVGQMTTGPGVDNIDWLPSRHLLYAASGMDGTLTVAEVAANGSMKPFSSSKTTPGGRTVIIDGAGTAYVPDSKGGRLLVVKIAR